MRGFLELLEGIFSFLQGLADLNEVFSWGGSKKNKKRNALQSNGPQPNTTGGCILRGLGCLLVLALVVLVVLYLIGTFVAPKKYSVPNQPASAPANPTSSSPTTPSSIKDIKIPTIPK